MRVVLSGLILCACSTTTMAPVTSPVLPPAPAETRVAEPAEDTEELSEEELLAIQDAEYDAEYQAYVAARQEHLAAFRAIVLPLDQGLADRATAWTAIEDPGMTFSVEEHAGATTVSFSESGQGVESTWSETRTVFRRGRRTLVIDFDGYDGSYVQRLELDRRATPAVRRDIEAAFATEILSGPSQRLFGLARLFTRTSRSPQTLQGQGFRVVGPLYSSAPDAATFPLRTGDAQTTGAMLLEHGSDVLRVAPVHTDCVAVRAGSHVLQQCRLVGRNSGSAVALMSDETRGRWVLETRNAVLGSRVDWHGEHVGYLFGHYGWSHPGGRYGGSAGLVALRVRDGAVYRIDVPGAYEDGAEVMDIPAERARIQGMQRCLEAAAAAQNVDRDELPASDYDACEPAPWNTFAVGAHALAVGRTDGSVVEIPFDKLMRVLP